ncbi:hypothetical protein [Microbispora sp. ATCC PTA-5024]|uniref:hypothetical protein n=1 Tax=Microbispora sp. ATCC PTA-5024 TaxID=316330 RepID=UPI0003DB8B9C|nr:hypothetical protein [Microbispora sp. ATCC PTA-5024]ETK35977.1 hypothetical protein MPTA5024_10160 [Microbispora sp. ATCC PTA-5024]
MRPADPDDIDARFEALIAQFDEDEIRRITAEAERGLGPGGRRARAPVVVLALAALVVAVGLVISLRPDVLGKLGSLRSAAAGGEPAHQPHFGPAVARPGPVLTPIADDDDAFLEGGGVASALPPVDPFAGSRAAGFADGVKGVVLPRARALGGLSRKQVAKALRRVRRLLAAARLDPAAIRGGRPSGLAKLLDPEQRAYFLKHLDKGRASNTRAWAFSLAPGSADLTTDTVKVDGATTTARRRSKDGRGGITITADYLLVYAVNRPGDRASARRLVDHYRARFSAWKEDGDVVVWLDQTSSGTAGASCDFGDGFVHPHFDGEPQRVQPSGPPADPYERRHDVTRGGCQATTGT